MDYIIIGAACLLVGGFIGMVAGFGLGYSMGRWLFSCQYEGEHCKVKVAK